MGVATNYVLSLTEAITHSNRNLKISVVHVYLDKEAAFDSALKEHIVREAFSTSNHIPSQSILYLAHRLASRKTYLKHQTTVMSPINDRKGIKQGGIFSSKLFQLTNDNGLQTLNATGLGVPIGPITIAALGQSDDEVLLSTNQWDTQTLINTAID